ncbi:MAG: glycosyltransferase family 2 protein, partial [Verrucomicrobia bacterium]|nr:glycosyltransferase family 2 protein [Verrucomicrobiota bacterium]
QMLCQIVAFKFRIGELSCPTRYFAEASSINFRRSMKYGLGVLHSTLQLALHQRGWRNERMFGEAGRKLLLAVPAEPSP